MQEAQGDPLDIIIRLARANERTIKLHERYCPARRRAEEMPAIVPPRVLAEIIAWMGAQWADTWSFDYEAAAVRFEIPEEVLRSEVASYLRNRGGRGRDRRN